MDVIDNRRRDLGGFEVGRVLPYTRRHMIGPFIFFDHIGPVNFLSGIPKSVDVRPHPHIGLATVTYLFAGEIMHRDSVGAQQPIAPNEVNWMIAGRGITHSERFERARREGGPMHGIQAWMALPNEFEEVEPSFAHTGADALPVYEDDGATTRLLAGSAFGLTAAVKTHSPLFYAHWESRAGRADRAARALSGARAVHRRGRDRAARHALWRRQDAGFRARGGQQPGRDAADHGDGARRRARRRALHRMELRFLVTCENRAGQGRLARRPDEAAGLRQQGIHPLA